MEYYQSIKENAAHKNKSDLALALEVLAAAKKEPYYNAQADEANRKNYYKGIQPDQLGAKDSYLRLSDLVKKTHTTKLGYDEARHKHLYPRVDLQPNNMLKSIYSGEEFSPETIIKADFDIAERVVQRATEQLGKMASMNPETFLEHLSVLAANATYNAEHSVPQSWFGKKDPMKGDLHHLFTCETTCNEYRGNIPFFDFSDSEKLSRPGCGKKEADKFEPAQGQGAVARATLYFLLRYPKEINNNSREYTKDRIIMLLKWHKEKGVSQYELHRNAEIFKAQGNRNPLIDHPEWSEKIDFLLGLG